MMLVKHSPIFTKLVCLFVPHLYKNVPPKLHHYGCQQFSMIISRWERFENIRHLSSSEVACPVRVRIVNYLKSNDLCHIDHTTRILTTISMTSYQESEKGSLRERRNICNGFGSLRRNCLGQAGHLLDHQILTYVLWGAL